MSTLGLCIITFNEEKTIEKCIKSVPNASQVVVVDSFSSDKTPSIVKSLDANFIQREWKGYADQKQFALDQMTTDWVLILDADEWMTKEGLDEIQKIMDSSNSLNAYEVPCFQFFMGRVLKYGRGVDMPLRFIRNKKARYDNKIVHERLQVDGPIGKLKNGMIHYSSPNVLARLEKIKRDCELEISHHKPNTISLRDIFLKPLTFFITMFIKRSAWKDGVPGIIWLMMFTIQYFIQFSQNYEKDLLEREGISEDSILRS